MALNSYVLSKYLSGTSGMDAQLVIQQAVRANRFEIEDPMDLIAGDMFASLEDVIDVRYTPEQIRDLLGKSGRFRLSPFEKDGKGPSGVYLTLDSEAGNYRYDVRGRTKIRQVYEVRRMNDADVGYLVTEHIVGPEPGVSLVERCYHTYFRKLQDAINYRDFKMDGYKTEKGSPESGWRILVVDVNEMEANPWYKGNLKANAMIRAHGLDEERYRYIGDVKELVESIKLDCYADLGPEEQADINYGIYMEIRDMVPEEERADLDAQLDEATADGFEAVVDLAITLCLVQASDESAFRAVWDALGRADYRIDCLTSDIYNAHEDEGYILVTRNGEIKWFRDAYFMNEWEGNADNPWFGKFQPNDNDTLLCFKEFRPDLIVDRFPSVSEMRTMERRYLTMLAEQRSRHDEMVFTDGEDDDGKDVPVCVGDWYFEGLTARGCHKGIIFARTYGSHMFDEDECRTLLNGEELVVEKFRTKSGREVAIRGRLKIVSGIYDADMDVQFTRTDISARNRKAMSAKAGIDAVEPGLPSDEDDPI